MPRGRGRGRGRAMNGGGWRYQQPYVYQETYYPEPGYGYRPGILGRLFHRVFGYRGYGYGGYRRRGPGMGRGRW